MGVGGGEGREGEEESSLATEFLELITKIPLDLQVSLKKIQDKLLWPKAVKEACSNVGLASQDKFHVFSFMYILLFLVKDKTYSCEKQKTCNNEYCQNKSLITMSICPLFL